MTTSLRGTDIVQTITRLPRHCSGNAPSVPLPIVILAPTLTQNQVSMGLTTPRHRLARYFAMAAMAVIVATSVALVAIPKRDGHGAEGDGAMLATLSGSFVYRPWISPADPRHSPAVARADGDPDHRGASDHAASRADENRTGAGHGRRLILLSSDSWPSDRHLADPRRSPHFRLRPDVAFLR